MKYILSFIVPKIRNADKHLQVKLISDILYPFMKNIIYALKKNNNVLMLSNNLLEIFEKRKFGFIQ